jgi:hypothetical protein
MIAAAAGSLRLLRALCGSVHVREEERMSFVTVQPEVLAVTDGHLTGIGSQISAQNAAAAPPTTADRYRDTFAIGTARRDQHARYAGAWCCHQPGEGVPAVEGF